jgi:GNAT superfamily N-acetyltransferase
MRLAGAMPIVRWAQGDDAGMRACCELDRACFLVDDPDGPPLSERLLRSYLEHPREPAQTWYLPAEAGEPGLQAMYHLQLPDRENLHRATLFLQVRPSHRRRGTGGALLRHAAQQAAQDGRTVLRGETFKGSAGEAFAQYVGAKASLADARRVLVVAKVPAGRIAALRESAARAAAGYSLVTWTGSIPEEYLAGFAGVFNALNDGPHSPGQEARIWDAERVRERIDIPREKSGNRHYAVAAVHDATGELAGVTQVSVDPDTLPWGQQLVTAVTRPHRGHRLGLLLKAAMIEWLASAEPCVARIVTTNDATNQYMIAVNEALGYELLDPQLESYELRVADVLRP